MGMHIEACGFDVVHDHRIRDLKKSAMIREQKNHMQVPRNTGAQLYMHLISTTGG